MLYGCHSANLALHHVMLASFFGMVLHSGCSRVQVLRMYAHDLPKTSTLTIKHLVEWCEHGFLHRAELGHPPKTAKC